MSTIATTYETNRAFNLIDKLKSLDSITMIFMGCLGVILGVSIYDTYLVVATKDQIIFNERNPICVALIRQDPHQLKWFIAGKMLGNLGVISVLVFLKRFQFQKTMTVTAAVTGFQVFLLVYLTFSDPKTGLFHFDTLLSDDPVRFRTGVNNLIAHIVVTTLLVGTAIMTRAYMFKSRQNVVSKMCDA